MSKMKSKYDIICLSSAYWDEPLWTNKQHIMSRLAKRGHRILYVEPGLSRKHLIKLLIGQLQYKRIFFWFRKGQNNLWIILPMIPLLRGGILKEFGWRVVVFLTRYFLKRTGFKNPILWIYHPEAVKVIGQFKESLICYDCVDRFSAFPVYASPMRARGIFLKEQELLKKADLIIATSEKLFEEKKKFNPHTYLVHNVGDVNHFRKAMLKETKVPDDIAGIALPIVGFYGAMDSYKVDFGLIKYIARMHPEWSIVLIGPSGIGERNTDLSQIKETKNIYLLGYRPYAILPNYLKAFNVCILPYLVNVYTESVFPIKFFEFLASSKPVVTTNLPALRKYKSITKIAKDRGEFISYIEEYLSKDTEEAKAERLRIAAENTWDSRIDKQLELITTRLADKQKERL